MRQVLAKKQSALHIKSESDVEVCIMRAGRSKTRSGNSIQFPFKLVFFGELNFNIWSFRLNIWNHVRLRALGQASMNSLCCSRFHKRKKFMAIYEAQHPVSAGDQMDIY